MSNNTTISCPQVTLVPLDFFGVVGDSAARRLINETRKPDRRAHVKYLAQLAIVAGLASSIEDTEAVSYTVLKDGSVRLGFQKTVKVNPWAVVEQYKGRINELDSIISHGKADSEAKHTRICLLEEKLHQISIAVQGPFGDVVNSEDYAVQKVQEILKDLVDLSISSIAPRFFHAAKTDWEYVWSWHCNLAMGIFDRIKGLTHKRANEIAADLMQVIFSVDIKTTANWKDLEKGWADGGGMVSKIGEPVGPHRDYEEIAEDFIKEAFDSISEPSRAVAIAAVRDFAERLTK